MSKLHLTAEGIPVISLKNYFCGDEATKNSVVENVAKACSEVGCFFVKDHEIPAEVIHKCANDMSTFFHLPLKEKLKYKKSKTEVRGYVPSETENINAFMGRPDFPNDPVEKFAFGPVEDCPFDDLDQQKISGFVNNWNPNVYPDYPCTLKSHVVEYYLRIECLAEILMAIFSKALRLPESFIFDKCNSGAHPLTINFYTELTDNEKSPRDYFPEHTDLSVFTLLYSSGKNKNTLQVRDIQGIWRFANPQCGESFFVNIGDCLARWTNDKWQSTPHKVILEQQDPCDHGRRISMVFFVLMNHDAVIECMPTCTTSGNSKYPPISFEQMRAVKIKRLVTTRV